MIIFSVSHENYLSSFKSIIHILLTQIVSLEKSLR